MKNLIKTFTLVGIVLFSFLGCADKADYEDKDLTKFFIKNNKEKLNRISSIDVFLQYEGSRDIDGSYKTDVKFSFFNFSPLYTIDGCDFTMFISDKKIEFLKRDVESYGKEYMYKKAQICLDAVIQILDENENTKDAKAENEALLKKRAEENLNKKFNENEIGSKK